MLARTKQLFYTSRAEPKAGAEGSPAETDAELLQQLEQQVPQATLAALRGSSDLPTGSQREVMSLLRRYLVAEKHSVSKAVVRLQHQAEWRQQFGTATVEGASSCIAAGKSLLQLPAADGSSRGRPIMIALGRKHLPGDMAEFERFIVLVLDTAAFYSWNEHNSDGKVAAILDLRGITMKNLQIAALRTVFGLLERRFPERLDVLYMLDAPTIFNAAWHIIEPFVDATSRKKIRFISGAGAPAILVKEVGAATVPTDYGGNAPALPLEQAVRQLPDWQQAQRQQQEQHRAPQAPALPEEQDLGALPHKGSEDSLGARAPPSMEMLA